MQHGDHAGHLVLPLEHEEARDIETLKQHRHSTDQDDSRDRLGMHALHTCRILALHVQAWLGAVRCSALYAEQSEFQLFVCCESA